MYVRQELLLHLMMLLLVNNYIKLLKLLPTDIDVAAWKAKLGVGSGGVDLTVYSKRDVSNLTATDISAWRTKLGVGAGGGGGIVNTATGTGSTGLGIDNTVTGDYSTAIGYKNNVSGNKSGAFGDPNVVTGNGSMLLVMIILLMETITLF